jgi:uncharacterized protein YjiK
MKIFLFAAMLIAAGAQCQTPFCYDLDRPDVQHNLPPILDEISGLTDIDTTCVAAVQDELGIVFIYNFKKGEIVTQYDFDKPGDFEGLTYAKNALYILRSDGRLTEWENFPKNKNKFEHYQLPLETSNNEGLCFDHKQNTILIAAKNKPVNKAEKSERFIYSYDIEKKKLMDQPLYSLNIEELGAKAAAFNLASKDPNEGKKKNPFNFRPSSLSVHPITDDIYIISAVDRLLIVMNRKGDIVQMKTLNPERFAKAEGITFLSNGTMIITNEAAGKTPTLSVFNMKPVPAK